MRIVTFIVHLVVLDLTRLSVNLLLSNYPTRIDAQPAIRSLKHQAGALIAFQLPVQPSNGNAAELAPVWLTIGATMSDSFFITSEYWNGRNALEIVVSVCKGDVLSIAANVCHRRMERF